MHPSYHKCSSFHSQPGNECWSLNLLLTVRANVSLVRCWVTSVVGRIMVLCVTRLYKPVLALRTSQSLRVRNPTTGMLFLIRFTKTHFLHLPNYGYWDVSYIVGKVWMRRLQRRWNRRKRFSIGGEIP